MRTFVFKAYNSKRSRKLHKQIDVAASIWNHCIALHKRFYRRFKKHLNQFRLMKHVTRLKQLHAEWKTVGSQAVQDIVQRIEKSYQLFFRYIKNRKAGITVSGRKVRPPSFRKRIKYTSFTLKQAGYSISGNHIAIGKQKYRFFNSRDIEGKIKTLTVKRDATGDIYFVIVTDAEQTILHSATTEIAGMDFGLKTFLKLDNGEAIISPEPFRKSLKQVKKANRSLSRKIKGSNHRKEARKALARLHCKIARQRKDFHFQTASRLVRTFNAIAIEDLNLSGMKSMWGRKVSDLGFASFVSILEHQASKTGCTIVKVDRWYPSSKMCNVCGAINSSITLRDRYWTCDCGAKHDRDLNAAINIKRAGASALGLGDVRPGVIPAIAV